MVAFAQREEKKYEKEKGICRNQCLLISCIAVWLFHAGLDDRFSVSGE